MSVFYSSPGCDIYDAGIHQIADNPDFYTSEQWLYCRLINLCRQSPNGTIKMSARAISDRSSIVPRTVLIAIPKLRDAGYINAKRTPTGWVISIPPPPVKP